MAEIEERPEKASRFFRFYVVDRVSYEFEPEGEDTRRWFTTKKAAMKEYREVVKGQTDHPQDFGMRQAVSLDLYHVPARKKGLLHAMNLNLQLCKVKTLRSFPRTSSRGR